MYENIVGVVAIAGIIAILATTVYVAWFVFKK